MTVGQNDRPYLASTGIKYLDYILVPGAEPDGVIATLQLLRRWYRDRGHRPSRERLWALHILLPLIPNLPLVAVPLLLQVKDLFGYMSLYMPDVSWIALICRCFAGIWTFLRTGLVLRAMKEHSVH